MVSLWPPKSDTSSVKPITLKELQLSIEVVKATQLRTEATLERIDRDLTANTELLKRLVSHLTK
ncbi:hypothetical protein GNF10_12220 [Nostoc sp. UCD121]|uniref:hypothetical protein n=1 Tax=unclassified Nostoc TaxID=2593658 RepID=UPI0016299A9A|nr:MULTISPECIES: hypothetical protein [unclassified Nostoc]MBC1224149.1 hypothetical protein [Nostoc sp. UCD120]MBC1276729.1 hypothetical protein [Nostoc sp. UCD121]MBC1296577.1 hypothetical protein [Nostoc sp. UCD122]